MLEKKFILFDFDGVIVDSFQLTFDISKMICPHITKAAYQKRFEGNIHYWQDPMDIHTPGCRLDLNFFDEYALRPKDEVKVFPEIKELLQVLTKTYTMIIISSSVTSSVQEFLVKNDLATYFSQVMGSDLCKSKVEKIKMVFEKYETTAADCLFITDTLGDLLEAQKMHTKAIAVTWGFHSSKTLLRGNPLQLVNSPRDLLLAINNYFKNK